MPEYRRFRDPGGMFFLTLVTGHRAPLFDSAENVARLRRAVVQVKRSHPFRIHGTVVLPDHLHFLWELPKGDTDYSKRIGLVKVAFTRSLELDAPIGGEIGPSKTKHRESGVWQRRFWEHTIRGERDYADHMNYIHYNPIKHGLAKCAHAWPYSSFQSCVRSRLYSLDWCCSCEGKTYEPPEFDEIEDHVGE